MTYLFRAIVLKVRFTWITHNTIFEVEVRQTQTAISEGRDEANNYQLCEIGAND